MDNRNIIETFEAYKAAKVNDYVLSLGGNEMSTHTTIIFEGEGDEHYHDEEKKIAYYSESYIQKLHPDFIDNKFFWKTATSNFPFFSIIGGFEPITDKQTIHNKSLTMAMQLGALKEMSDLVDNKQDAKVLEIGPGYGSLLLLLEKYGHADKYSCIDINPLFKFERMYECNGRMIPKKAGKDFDMVYSFNVFQHLSKKQRTSYYKDIYKKLNSGGSFVFGMFVRTEQNKDWSCWGTADYHGRFYTNFFRQLTEVDELKELLEELNSIGFEVKRLNPYENVSHYLSFKCKKK